MKKWTLEQATNVVIIISCVFAVAVMATRLTQSENGGFPGPREFARGSRAPSLEKVDYGRYKYTVVAFVRSSCKFCTDSMPLYKRVAQNTPSDVQFVAASIEPVSVTEEYLRSHAVETDMIVRIDQPVATPTVLVVNKSGIIDRAWVGWLDSGREQTFLQALRLQP